MSNQREANGPKAASSGSGRPELTAVQLRKLAEAADGMRGESLVLVWGSSNGEPERYQVVPQSEIATMSNAEEILAIRTERKRPIKSTKYPRGDVDSVKISFGKNVRDLELAEKYDAVFWSESAVEKFLLEYYLPLKEKEEWDALYQLYMNPPEGALEVYAIAHEYPTVDTKLHDVPATLLTAEGPMSIEKYVAQNLKFLPG